MNRLSNSPRLKATKTIIIRSFPEQINDLFLILLFSFKYLFVSKSQNLVIVSAADESHFSSVQNLFDSLQKFEKDSILVFYDIGLNHEQENDFKSKYPQIVYKKFKFTSYPDFVSKIDRDGKVGSYAWKPQIIKECINDYNTSVLWLDAGCKISKKLRLIRIILNVKGLYIASSVGKIYEWTYSKSIENFKFPQKYLNKKNFASGMVGINPERKYKKELLDEWAKLSLNKNIIAPENSSRKNHRQDQSILTMLIYKNGLDNLITKTFKIFGITIHNDPKKIYFWPINKNLEVEKFFVNWTSRNLNHTSRTYKNAEYLICSNLEQINKIKKVIKKNQKLIYISNMSDLNENQLKKYNHLFSKVLLIQSNEVIQPNIENFDFINIHDFKEKLFS
ncbi:MAG: hypothetical protein CBD76_00310 [Pelagibacteraceae bacterium TMED216]|nr:MAG: hypothetical protein CBD76_00310 [Pelagibacteraceae bacterium TMED216]